MGSSTFQQDVNNLPTSLDANGNGYNEFVQKYGTHMQIGVDMGGRATQYGIASVDDYFEQSAMNLQLNAHIAFLHLKHTFVSPYAGVNRQNSLLPSNIFSHEVLGGKTTEFQPGNYDVWVKSVVNNPTAYNFDLIFLDSLIARVSPEKAELYTQYVLGRLKSISDEVEGVSVTNPWIFLSASEETYPCNGVNPYTELAFWDKATNDDDDDCMVGAWYVVDYVSGDPDPANICRRISFNDWNTMSGIFSPAQFAGSTGDNTKMTSKQDKTPPKIIDTEEIQYNMDCGLYPCIPGLDSMGSGIDIITGMSKISIFQWSFNNSNDGNLFHDGNLSENFAFPDQVLVSSETQSSTSSNVYKSYDEVCSSQSASASGWDGLFFEWGADSMSLKRSFEGSQSVIGVSEKLYYNYRMELNQDEILLSEIFLNAIESLPEQFDDRYFEFISYWGTHVVGSAFYGGKAKLLSRIDQTFFVYQDEYSIEETLSAQFDNWALGIQWGNAEDSVTADFSKHSFQIMTFYGGEANLALTSDWNSWINSTYYRPAQMNVNLIPIQTFVDNPTIAENIELAVNLYYNMSKIAPGVDVSLTMNIDTKSSGLLSNDGTILTDYLDTCDYEHGFFNEYHQLVSIDLVSYTSYEIDTNENDSEEIVVRYYSTEASGKCPFGTFVREVSYWYPDCALTTHCADGDTLVNGKNVTCVMLAYNGSLE